jgi:hypothetical protein
MPPFLPAPMAVVIVVVFTENAETCRDLIGRARPVIARALLILPLAPRVVAFPFTPAIGFQSKV